MDWDDVAIKLGDRCKDKVTGVTGMIVAKIEYLNGCRHFELQPKVNKDGEVPRSYWPDIEQVELVKTRTRKKTPGPPIRRSGGPMPNPPGLSTPPGYRGES